MPEHDSSLPDLAALPQHLQDELRRHEQRTRVALKKWKASRRGEDYDEAICGVMCVRALAESHGDPDESAASRKARKKIRDFAEDLRQAIVDERNKALPKPRPGRH